MRTAAVLDSQFILAVNPNTSGDPINVNAAFLGTDDGDYKIFSKTYGTEPSFSARYGYITVPANSYAIVGSSTLTGIHEITVPGTGESTDFGVWTEPGRIFVTGAPAGLTLYTLSGMAVSSYPAGGNLTIEKRGEKFTHRLSGSYSRRDIDGIQYLSQRDNTESYLGWVTLHADVRSTFKTDDIRAAYSLIKNRGNEYSWRADASVNFVNKDDQFILPNSTMDSKNIYANVDFKKNFIVTDDMDRRLLAEARLGMKKSTSGAYEYNGSYADYPTVTTLMPLEESYLLSDAWNIGWTMTYSQLVKKDAKVNGYVKIDFNYQDAKDFDFGDRSNFTLSLGANF